MNLPPDSAECGQIRMDSPFGQLLSNLARESDVIVEIGTWRGLGSTYCLFLGMTRSEQHLWTVELGYKQFLEAQNYYDKDAPITFIHGTLVLPDEVPPFTYPDPEFKKYYDFEVELNKTAPYVLDQIPERIDLLLIDGGAWSGPVEFGKLWQRAKIIALDDTNPALESKNCENRVFLLNHPDWDCLADNLNDRHGWAVFRRKTL